jgi:hypothetical protein
MEKINIAKTICVSAKRHLREIFMCFSSLGLYVLPAALSSFKELAEWIKQLNEVFCSSFQDERYSTPTYIPPPRRNSALFGEHGFTRRRRARKTVGGQIALYVKFGYAEMFR